MESRVAQRRDPVEDGDHAGIAVALRDDESPLLRMHVVVRVVVRLVVPEVLHNDGSRDDREVGLRPQRDRDELLTGAVGFDVVQNGP